MNENLVIVMITGPALVGFGLGAFIGWSWTREAMNEWLIFAFFVVLGFVVLDLIFLLVSIAAGFYDGVTR